MRTLGPSTSSSGSAGIVLGGTPTEGGSASIPADGLASGEMVFIYVAVSTSR